MPVLLLRLEEDDIAQLDPVNSVSLTLYPAQALCDENRLPCRMRVPAGTRARFEGDDAAVRTASILRWKE